MQFYQNEVELGEAVDLSNGICTYTTGVLNDGSYTFRAEYTPDYGENIEADSIPYESAQSEGIKVTVNQNAVAVEKVTLPAELTVAVPEQNGTDTVKVFLLDGSNGFAPLTARVSRSIS